MASIDRDYVLGIAVQLQTESIQELESQLQAAADKIKPISVKAVAYGLEQAASSVQKYTRSLKDATDQADKLNSSLADAKIKDFAPEQEKINRLLRDQTQIIEQNTAAYKEQADAVAVLRDKMSQNTAPLLNSQTLNDALQQQRDMMALKDKFRNMTVVGPDGDVLEKQNKALEKYVPQLNAAIEAQGKMNSAQSVLSSWLTTNSSGIDHFAQSLKNMALWAGSGALLFGGAAAIGKGMSDAVRSQQEQVMQGFYYPQGTFTPQISAATQGAALGMAREYGDEVMHVQEAIGLWAKVTNGELLPAIALTNDALKLNAVTGMNMEEIYRASAGAIQQLHQPLSRVNDLYQIGIGLATRYGGGMKLLGGESQDATRQMIEGITRAGAVLSDTGMNMEQIGAAVAVTMQKMNIEGAEAGSGLARAFAALGRGKPHEILQQAGIEIEHNSHLLEDLASHWNKVGDALKGSVQSSALEYLDVIISSVKEYEKAVQTASSAKNSDILDRLFKQIEGTDAYKLMQAKAGIESFAITMGKELLPEIATVADYFNNNFVPSLIRMSPEIMSVVKDVGFLVAAFAGLSAIRLAGSMIAASIASFRNFGIAVNGAFGIVPIEERVAATALTDYQRALLATLTENNTVTAEMEVQIRTLAAAHNVSVNSMIEAWLKARGMIPEAIATIEGSEEGIAGITASVASQVGLDASEIETAFTGMATTAESSANLISTAFMKAIPVIGQVLLVAGLAKGAYDWARSDYDQADKNRMQYDKTYRNQRLFGQGGLYYEADMEKYYFEHPENSPYFQHTAAAQTSGFSPAEVALFWRAHPEVKSDLLAQAKAHYADYGDLLNQAKSIQSGAEFEDPAQKYKQMAQSTLTDVKKQLEQAELEAKKYLGDTYSSADKTNPDSGGTTIPKANQALNAQADAILRNLNLLTKKDEADQRDVATAKLQIQHTNDKTAALERLREAYSREIADRQKDITAVQGQITHFNNLANSAANPQQQQTFLNKANALQAGLQVLQSQLTYLKAAKQVDVNDQLGAILSNQYAPSIAATKEAMKNMADGMKLKTETIPDLQALHASLNENLYLANRLVTTFTHMGDNKDATKFKAWAEGLASDLSTVDTNMESIRQKASDLVGTLAEETTTGEEDLLFPGDKAVSRYGKAMDQIQRKLLEYQKLEQQDPGDTALQNAVNQWYAVETAVAQTTYAVDAYQEKLKALQNTPTYAAITALGNDLGSTLTSDVMSAFTASDNNQVNAIQSQITALQNEKNLLQGKNSEVERMMLEQRISQLEKDKAGIEERMKHPGFLKGIEEDMAKAVMKGLTDRLTKDLQDAFVNSILGKNPQNNPVVVATDTNTTATQENSAVINQLNANLARMASVSNVSGGSFSVGSGMGSGSSLFGAIASAAGLSTAGTLTSMGPGYSIPGSTVPGTTSSGAYTGTTVPSVSNGAYTGGTGAGAYSAIAMGASMFPFFGSPTGNGFGVDPSVYNQSVSSGGGAWNGGFKTANGKINVSGIMQALGGASAAVQGYDQGGFAGSLEAGLGVYSLMTSSLFSGGMAAFLGSVAPYAAAAMFLASLFHPHYNPSQNPDMFADSGYAQGLADAQGWAYTQANGWVSEDPGLKNQLGGQSELQYLDAWYNSYPGGQGLNSQGKQLWDEIGKITGNGKGLEVRGLHQGNVYVSLPGQDSQVGESGNWQTVLQDIDSATQQLYALENQDMTGKGTWISVNSYGAGGGASADFSPWYSPGLSSSDISATLAMPYPPLNSNGAVSTSPGDPSGGTGPGGGPVRDAAGFGVSPLNVSTAVYLNTDVIAQQVNAFNIQRQTSGWAMNY